MKASFTRMIVISLTITFLFCSIPIQPAEAQRNSLYYPGKKWETRKPEQVGMDGTLLAEAIEFAKTQREPKSVAEVISARQRQESHPEIIGPTKERGEINGLVIRHGYIVAEFGDTARSDMTFSVTKSFLSAVAGLAFDKGLIKDVNDPIKKYVNDGGFDSPHNSKITWHHMLQQTSEWEGNLWEKPHTIDERPGHVLKEPGTNFNYNDVRVNRLSLALLRVMQKPLPEILRKEIMEPIGASDTWIWNGYRNSDVVIGGRKINSVSGGGHWGGGLFINSHDMARFGLLFLRRGKWQNRQLISERWIDMMTAPSKQNESYGYLWWLSKWPGATKHPFAARGAGGNVIWVSPEHDLVVVLRWAAKHEEVYKRIVAAIKSPEGR